MGSSRPSRDRFTDILKGWAWRSAAETAQRRGLGTAARNQRLTLLAELRRPGLVAAKRTAATQLGFAMILLYMRNPGRVLAARKT